VFFKDTIAAANISRLEYYIDTDPGFGNANPIGVAPVADIIDVSWSLDISAFTNGFHNIYVRARDNNGNWSLTNRWSFYKDRIPAANISRLEYFIDTDPGLGNANAISVTAAADLADVFWSMDISGYSNGFHNIYMRSMDNNGNWSLTNKWLFFKDKTPASKINRLEYFIDTDPGFGNATSVAINPVADTSDVNFTVDITSLPIGFHNIYMRSRDDNGSWSLTNRWLLFKDQTPAANITKFEYFVDTDPGFGNGVDVAVTTGSDISDLSFSLNTTPLSEGFHKIFLRSKDNNGSWSLTNRWVFFKEYSPVPLNFKKGEYFFDTDPGFGNGTPIPFTAPMGGNIADFNFAADISSLTNAPHYMFVRDLDSNNKWSLTNVIEFSKNSTVPVTMLAFNAQLIGKKSLLTWKTASEINSSHFIVEKSNNGFQYENIGKVKAAGNSSTTKGYQFVDNTPSKGMNYYRIMQVDLDAQTKYSDVRKIEIKTDAPLFALYNNASNGSDIIIKSSSTPSLLGIFDASGKKLKEITVVGNSQHIDLSTLPSGIYNTVLYRNGEVIGIDRLVIRH